MDSENHANLRAERNFVCRKGAGAAAASSSTLGRKANSLSPSSIGSSARPAHILAQPVPDQPINPTHTSHAELARRLPLETAGGKTDVSIEIHDPDRELEPKLGRSVSIDQAATLLSLSRRTIYNRIREGQLVTIRTMGGSQRVLVESLIRLGFRPQAFSASAQATFEPRPLTR